MRNQVLVLWFILTCLPNFMAAQSDLLFNNHQINAIARNPAAIEENGMINAYLGIHQQWMGFEDAPYMQWVGVSSFFDRYNMGVNLNITNQSEGVATTQNIKVGYTYHVHISGLHRLFFGVGAGFYFRRLDYSKLRFDDDETNVPLTDENVIRPDFDFGFEYLFGSFKFGAAANHVTVFNSKATLEKIPWQTQAYANYKAEVGEDFQLIPEISYFRSSRIAAYGISLDMQYRSVFGFGMAYRTGQSIIFRASVFLSNRFELRYAYDMGAGKFATYHSGIHEVVLIGRFNKRSSSLNSPRFLDN